MLWGLSHALDLLTEYEKVTPIFGKKEINVLLLGSTDGRHMLKTMSSLQRHPADDTKINFFVMDLANELVARQLLLLTIALEPGARLGPQEKARLWMEVFGNTLLRPVTAKYVMSKGVQLIRMATDKAFMSKRMPIVDLEHLKYKEIDQLENIFKYWILNRYSIVKIWDIKLRKSLGSRYDSRLGIFDWDYNMKLKEMEGAQRICSNEYKMWRNTGVAFTWLETEYSVGNPTLAVGVCAMGDTLYSHGYLGDMESGPFFAFGTDSEEEAMLEVRNGRGIRRATDITERNLERMFHELEHAAPPMSEYSAPFDLGQVVTKAADIDVEKDVSIDYEPDRTPESYIPVQVPNCRVIFLSGNAKEVLPKKSKYKEFFDIVFVAQNFFKFLNAEIMSMAKPNGCLIVETRKFVVGLCEKISDFGNEVRLKLRELGWEEVKKCHFRKDDHVACKKKKGKAEEGAVQEVDGGREDHKRLKETTPPREIEGDLKEGEEGSLANEEDLSTTPEGLSAESTKPIPNDTTEDRNGTETSHNVSSAPQEAGLVIPSSELHSNATSSMGLLVGGEEGEGENLSKRNEQEVKDSAGTREQGENAKGQEVGHLADTLKDGGNKLLLAGSLAESREQNSADSTSDLVRCIKEEEDDLDSTEDPEVNNLKGTIEQDVDDLAGNGEQAVENSAGTNEREVNEFTRSKQLQVIGNLEGSKELKVDDGEGLM